MTQARESEPEEPSHVFESLNTRARLAIGAQTGGHQDGTGAVDRSTARTTQRAALLELYALIT